MITEDISTAMGLFSGYGIACPGCNRWHGQSAGDLLVACACGWVGKFIVSNDMIVGEEWVDVCEVRRLATKTYNDLPLTN